MSAFTPIQDNGDHGEIISQLEVVPLMTTRMVLVTRGVLTLALLAAFPGIAIKRYER